jgi:DNA-binding MarR family transcriptional regulator
MKRNEVFEIIHKVNDPVKDSDKILANLHYTHFFLIDSYKKTLLAYDLTPTQANVLGIISFFYPRAVTLEEVKEMVLEPNSDVSRTVTRLAEKGFVEKVINKENRRKISIMISTKGQKILKKIESEGKFKKVTSLLDLREARNFVKTLQKLREATK